MDEDVKLAIGPKHPTPSAAAVAVGRVGTGITGSVTVTASPKSKADRAAAAENDEYEARRIAKTAYRIRPFGVLVVLIIALGASLVRSVRHRQLPSAECRVQY